MRTVILTLMGLAAGLGGCAPSQPFVNADRLQRGLVVVLPGIEGRSRLNEEITRGLALGGVNWAIEIQDWTSPWGLLHNLRARERNRQKADELWERIRRYRRSFPARPVILLGHSGGGAMAVWITEAMPPEEKEQLEGLILVNASLSREYDLTEALRRTRRGIVSYYSGYDWMLLGVGTTVYGTMDGEHGVSAGMEGFLVPTDLPRAYDRLYQIGWSKEMARAGHRGGHFSSADARFIAEYVAPLIRIEPWSDELIRKIRDGQLPKTLDSPAEPPPPPTNPNQQGIVPVFSRM